MHEIGCLATSMLYVEKKTIASRLAQRVRFSLSSYVLCLKCYTTVKPLSNRQCTRCLSFIRKSTRRKTRAPRWRTTTLSQQNDNLRFPEKATRSPALRCLFDGTFSISFLFSDSSSCFSFCFSFVLLFISPSVCVPCILNSHTHTYMMFQRHFYRFAWPGMCI